MVYHLQMSMPFEPTFDIFRCLSVWLGIGVAALIIKRASWPGVRSPLQPLLPSLTHLQTGPSAHHLMSRCCCDGSSALSSVLIVILLLPQKTLLSLLGDYLTE